MSAKFATSNERLRNECFSISEREYEFLKRTIKNKPKKTLEDNCYLKLFDKILRMTRVHDAVFLTDKEAEERNKFNPNPNFNILIDILREKTDGESEIFKTDKYGLFKYTHEKEDGEVVIDYIHLPCCNTLVKIEKKNKDITFIYCFPKCKEYIVARDVLSRK